MNVLCLIHYPVFGGPHNRVLNLEPQLARRGVKTIVALPDTPGTAAERLRSGGVEVVQVRLGRLRATADPRAHVRFLTGFSQDVSRLRQIIRSRDIDLVVVAGLVNPHGALAAKFESVPVLWQIVDTRTPPILRAAMMPTVSRLADVVMFGADSLIDAHPGARRLAVPSVVSRPAVDIKRFRPSAEARRATREEFGIPPNATVLGTVANLNPQKGIEYLIRAASFVEQRRPGCWLLIVGAHHRDQAAYLDKLEAEAEASPLPRERLIFTGARHDVENVYPALDVKLITSIPKSEGTTTTAIEAMASGVPVVATDVGAVAEVVEDGSTGLLAPPRDASALAEQTLRILDDASLAERLTAEGRSRVKRSHSVTAAANRQIEAYEIATGSESQLGKRSRRHRPLTAAEKPSLQVAFFAMMPSDNAATRAFCEVPLRYLPFHDIEGRTFPPTSTRLHGRFQSSAPVVRQLLAGMYWYGIVLPRRLKQLMTALRFDVIFVQRGLLRYTSPPVLEGVIALVGRRLLGRKLIFHLDDALYEVARGRWVAARCRCADLVLTGNRDIAAFAEAAGAKVEILDGWVETNRYPVKRHQTAGPVTIGYVGTFAEEHLRPIAEVLAEVCQRTESRLKVVSRNPVRLPGLDAHLDWERWTPQREFALFEDFDIGIMPLVDTSYNRAKEGYKLKEYMAAGLPVVCSPVGQNVRLVDEGVNGFLASSREEWVRSLVILAKDAALRTKLGENGRQRVHTTYSAELQVKRLARTLQCLATAGAQYDKLALDRTTCGVSPPWLGQETDFDRGGGSCSP